MNKLCRKNTLRVIEEWTNLMNQSLAKKDLSVDKRKKLDVISKKYQSNLQLTLYIIPLNEFG